jgi:uncharacterized protein YkwD
VFSQNEQFSDVISQAELLFMERVNEFRKSKKIAALQPLLELQCMALNHNLWMRHHEDFTHSEKKGTTFFTGSSLTKRLEFVRQRAVNNMIGENIALVQLTEDELEDFKKLPEFLANEFFETWKNSTGHRENMLEKGFKNHGISILKKNNKFYATHVFRD